MKLEGAGLIEDYFVDNGGALWDVGLDGEDDIATEIELVDPFCITGPSVLEFELSLLPPQREGSFLAASLLIDDVQVAFVAESDAEPRMSLVYRGSVELESEVRVVIRQNDVLEENIVLPDGFILGYKLWGPHYNLIDEPGESCLAL